MDEVEQNLLPVQEMRIMKNESQKANNDLL